MLPVLGPHGRRVSRAWRLRFTMMGLRLLPNNQTVKRFYKGLPFGSDNYIGQSRDLLLNVLLVPPAAP
jgi:hypothetical protein